MKLKEKADFYLFCDLKRLATVSLKNKKIERSVRIARLKI